MGQNNRNPSQTTQEERGVPGDASVVHLFSLRIPVRIRGIDVSAEIDQITSLVTRKSNEILYRDEYEVNAIFHDIKSCMETAQEAFRICLHHQAAAADQAPLPEIGLHSISAIDIDRENIARVFAPAIGARQRAAGPGILMTSVFYTCLVPELQAACEPTMEYLPGGIMLFKVKMDNKMHPYSAGPASVPRAAAEPGTSPCFYCGVSAHQTALCPSKLIQQKTNHLERLAHLPLNQIQQLYLENMPDLTKPLQQGPEEKRFGTLLDDSGSDFFSLCLYAFYEITEVFQQRSLRQLCANHRPGKPHTSHKTGSLLLGQDCLRVSRYAEAAEWFDKAIKEAPDDYRPQLFLGVMLVEQAAPAKALPCFRKALSFAVDTADKAYIHLLIARLYEASEALYDAKEENEKAVRLRPDWLPARYQQAVILSKLGQKSAAIPILENLLEESPLYHLVLQVDPQLIDMGREINALLARNLQAMRSSSLETVAAIKETMHNFATLFSKDAESYKQAHELFLKATDALQQESIAGLCGQASLERRIRSLYMRAIDQRRQHVRTEVSLYVQIPATSSDYLARFPYKGLLSAGDFEIHEEFASLFESALEAVESRSPHQHRKAEELLPALSEKAAVLRSNQERLDLMKNIYFVLECVVRVLGIFAVSGLVTTMLITAIIITYKVVEASWDVLTFDHIVKYLQIGIYGGFCVGGIASGIWFKKSFNRLHKKIEILKSPAGPSPQTSQPYHAAAP